MKLLKLFLFLALHSFLAPSLFSQGNLTPPGPPAPTMKTLDQIEARKPVSSAPFTIDQPGSYYLTKNLNVTKDDAITINAKGVTLDLNGFTLSSTAPNATGTAILLGPGVADITVVNGNIRGGVTYNAGFYTGPGFANGISCSAPGPTNVHVARVSISGCQTFGINLGANGSTSCLVEYCSVNTVGFDGIIAEQVSHCSVRAAHLRAINATLVSDSFGESLADTGISAGGVSNSVGIGDSAGIVGTTVLNCRGSSTGVSGNGSNGIVATVSAQNSSGYAKGVGLTALVANNCYGESTQGPYGLSAKVATGCVGYGFGSSWGLRAEQIATSCYGVSTGSGFGLWAVVGNTCNGSSGTAGNATSIAYKYNSP